jgi:hypothetical protein
LLSSRYSKNSKLTYADILPATVSGVDAIDYILERTLMRPRDVIEFLNICIKEVSLETGFITEDTILDAEAEYSQSRLNALAFEWFNDYPGLKRWTKILNSKKISFNVNEISENDILEILIDYIDNPPETDYGSVDLLLKLALDTRDEKISVETLKNRLMHIFYSIGLVGIKNSGDRKISWSDSSKYGKSLTDIEPETEIRIHPCYVRSLRIKTT